MKHFGTDGIRCLGEIFTEEYLTKISGGIALLPHCNKIIIGRDPRISGSRIERIMANVLSSYGVEIVLGGMIPTPTLAFLTKYLACDYGIMLSASHNPPEYNGVKLFSCDGEKVSEEIELAVEFFIENPKNIDVKQGKVYTYNGEDEYVKYLLEKIDADLNGVKVAIDTANGATSIVAKKLFELAGASVTQINGEIDGININKKCGATVPETLREFMKGKDFDIGFTFDGDGDRVMCVANDRIFNGDHLMYVHCKASGEKVMVGTIMSNYGTEIACQKSGIRLVRTGVGDKFVFREMVKNGYHIGGEESGHIIFIDYLRTGDGMTAALLTAKLNKQTALNLLDDIEEYPSASDCVMCDKLGVERFKSSKGIKYFLENLDKKYRTVVRPSGTEPKIRILVEAEIMEDAIAMAQKIKETINENIQN